MEFVRICHCNDGTLPHTTHLPRPPPTLQTNAYVFLAATRKKREAPTYQPPSLHTPNPLYPRPHTDTLLDAGLDAGCALLTGGYSGKLQSHSHPYAATYAMRSQARWQHARMKLRHPLAIIKYYSEAHVEEMGRGEPFGAELDAALSISALSEGMMAMATQPQTLGSFTTPTPSGAMSSVSGSSLGGSASQAGSASSSQLSAMSSQLGEVISGLRALSDDSASLRKRMAKLEEDHNNIGKCHLCGRKGHKKEDCPDKDKSAKQ